MQITIIGAGVVGVTTAWALARRGYQVTVVDTLPGPAQETSQANAGQRSYGFASPWADPELFGAALRGLLRAQGPFKTRLPTSARTLQFLCMTLDFALQPDLFARNQRAMLTLGQYSRSCFDQLDDTLALDYEGAHNGMMELASDRRRPRALMARARLLDDLDIEHEWLSAQAARRAEPALQGKRPLHGALRLPGDGTGDCQAFTRALAEQCAKQGVEFRYKTRVTHMDIRQNRIQAVHVESDTNHDPAHRQPEAERLATDQVVLCAGVGARDLAYPMGLSLPIYPVKGYSLTAQVRDHYRAPRSTLIDDHHHMAMTRIGDRVRVTGFAELAGQDRRMPKRRLAALKRGFDDRFPGAADLRLAKAWTGFRPMTPDGPPLIGQCGPDNLMMNTGHGTFGWTLSAGSAELVAQLIAGEQPDCDTSAFNPNRFNQS